MGESRGNRPPYLPVLDGLRAVAVLLVLWSHVPPSMPGYPDWLRAAASLVAPGYLGVDVFFVLSGFLITRILLAERARGQPLRWFLLRRMLRIFPIYYLLLAVIALTRPGPELPWCAVYLANFWFPFEGGASPVRHTWSLCVEEHFYLLWPLCIAFLPAGWARRLLVCLVFPLSLGTAFVACSIWDLSVSPAFVQYGSMFRFLSLGAGCLLAYVEQKRATEGATGPFTSARVGKRSVALVVTSLLGAAFLVSQLHLYILLPNGYSLQFDAANAPPLPYRYTPAVQLLSFALTSTAVLLLVTTFSAGRSPLAILRTLPLRGLGRISYGVYLYHLPIYAAVLHPAPDPARALLAVTLTLAVATVSFLCIERPILRFAARFRRAPSRALRESAAALRRSP